MKYSSSELEQVQKVVKTAQPWASKTSGLLVARGITPDTNKVRVGLTKITPEIRAEAERSFGDQVELHEEPRGHFLPAMTEVSSPPKHVHVATTTTTTTGRKPSLIQPAAAAVAGPPLVDSAPYAGGDRMFREIFLNGKTYIEQCAVAFAWSNDPSTITMASAGHCGPNNVSWTQGYYDKASNTLYESGPMGTQYVSSFQSGNADFMLMDNGSYIGQMWENTSGSYRLARVIYSYDAVQGQNVCLNGSFSGTRCAGVVEVPDECIELNGVWPDTQAS